MNDKGKQFYEYLLSKNIEVPANYEEFQSAMQDSATASQFYSFVISKGITVPESVDEFSSVFSIQEAQEVTPDVKKKEQTEPTQTPNQVLPSVPPTPTFEVASMEEDSVSESPTQVGVSASTRTDEIEPQVDGQELTQVSEITEPFVMEEQPLPDTEDVLEKTRLYDNKIQSERNENIKKYGLDLTKGQLTDVFESPIPEEEDAESYLSKQIGRVTSSANNIANNPKAFGLPADISQMNPNEREEVVDRYIARNYEMRGDGVNMNESELRNVFNQKFDQALAKRKADRDVMLEKESDDELLKAGISEEGLKPYKLAQIKQRDVSLLNPNQAKLYEANVKLQDITSQIKSITSKYEKETGDKLISKVGVKTLDQRISELNSEGDNLTKLQEKGFTDQASLDAFNKRVEAYNSSLESINKEIESEKIKQDKIQKDYAKDQETLSKLMGEYKSQQEVTKSLMGNIREDGRIMVDYLTGQHVDKLSDDDDADITEAVNAQIVEFNQPTYKDQLDDIYIKVGLRDQRHREFGNEATDDVTIGTTGMARNFSSDAAINRLRSLGYEEVGGVGEVTFKNVPIREQASSYVINVLDESKRDRADRWLATNKQNLIEREALKNMVLLNMDPTFEKGILSGLKRGVEVLTEELLPSYASADKALGFTSERKLADAALPLLQEEGIELTENQKKTLERTFGEQATEATFGMIPFIGKVVAVNYMLGPVRALSGFDDLIRVLKYGDGVVKADRVSRLTAAFLEASFEEGTMQVAGAPTGMGFGFSAGGKLFKTIGLDKFPLRPTGDWARSNKALDAFWSHAIKGTSSAEFASVVESMVKDFEGGETFENFVEENYSDLSDVAQRMMVNAVSFSAMGVKDLGFFYQKGKSGFNIKNMETARDEAQRKGYKEEADMLTKYINEYYAGKPDKAQPLSYNDMKTFVDNIPDNKSVEFTVSSREEIPVEFRDKKIYEEEGVEKEVDKTFLGIPIGKKTVTGKTYSYVATGKEMREVLEKMQGEKTEAEFEREFDMSQKAEEPSVGKEVMRTEPTETVKRKGRVTKFSAKKGDIVGEIVFEDGTKKELTQEEYDALGKQEGLFDVEVPVEKKITKEEYEMEMAKKLAETQPTPKEPAAKEQLALGEGTPKELSPKQKEAYNGLTKEEKQAVNELISDEQYELSIGAKDVEKPKDLTKEESAIWDYENKIAKESITYEDALNNALGVVAEKQKADGEVFTFGQDKYNIDKAVNLANTEGIEPIEIGIETTPKLRMPFVLKTEEGIENADLSKPVIIATTKDGLMLIDGHHRLEKAIREGKPVKAQILSESQTLEIKEGKAEPKEAAPVELKEGEIDITTVFKNPVEKNNEQAVAASNEFKDKAGEYDEGVNDPKFKEENTTVEEISVDDIVPTQERLFEENLKSPSEGEPLAMKVGDKYYVEDGHHRIGNGINADNQTVSVRVYESDKAKEDAIQEQEAADVPKTEQPEAVQEVEGEVREPAKEEVLSEEDAKSKEKVKEFAEKQMSDEKKQEEADKEIESKSEEELKEDVPDVLESISESERERLDREAKFKRKSTVDYVIDYLKGKLKNVRQSIKNILEKIKSNYRKAIITTAVIASVVKGSEVKIGGTSLRDVFKDATELVVTEGKSQGENLALDFAVENPEGFKAILESYGENKYLDAIAAKAGVYEPEVFEVEKVEVSEITPKDTVDVDALREVIKKNDGKLKQKVDLKPGVTFVTYRNTFLADEGQEYVMIPRRDEREATGYKDIEGVQYVAHHTLDDQVIGNKRGGNSGFHNASMKMDGYVPYTLKRQVDKETGEVREIITYKKYSEIADTSKGIGEILSTDPKIGPPFRQFKFGDIDWDSKPKWTSNTAREKKGYSGSRVMKTSVELLLKPGKKNPYRTDGLPEKDPYGNYMNPRGTHILYFGGRENAPTGDAYKGAIGKYNGGSFVYIFDYKGKTVVREVGSSVSQLKEEGEAIIKQFGVNPKDLILGYHDAGSVSAKLEAKDGKITEPMMKAVNATNPDAGGGWAIPIENKIPRDKPTEGETPISLMALPLLFGGARRKRKSLSDPATDKVVTEWMEDVQKIYDAQKTKNKREARDQAAVNLALSGKLDNLAPDQVKAVLEGIQTETDAMGKKWSVSTVSELEGLTIKQQFKQGFEEYVAAMKQKEADKIKKAKDSAQKKIDAAKERTAKVIEKIKDDKEARKLFEAIVNDLAKDSGLSQISRNKASELLKSSRDVNAQNLERLIQKAVRVIQYEYTRNIVKESDKKISDFKKNIEKNEFGTLTQTAKELAQITTQDIPIGLLPRFVDVIDGVSKKSPSAKDLEELAKFMSEFKNELDQQITDIQYFADVLNDFKSQEETEKIDDYLKENGFTEAQIEFFKDNRKAINAAYKSFYTKDGKELTAQEKIQKISEQMLDAKKVFREMKKNGEAKVDLKKFKGKVQREVDIAEFFNNIEESDIDYLTRSEANKLPVVFDNLNRGMVTNAEKRIMNRIKGERDLDAFEKEDPKSPIKRAKTKDGVFKSFVSNAAEFSKLERSFDPSVLKSSKELKEDIEKKVLDYADEAIKGLKGKPLYNQISKVIRPLVGANTKIARIHEKANELFKKMDGSPLHNTTLMAVYFRSREFDLNPNNPKIKNPLEYIEKTLKNPNLSEKKRAVLKGIRNEYFRNGKPSTKDMLSFIKKNKGGPLIEFMDEVMASRKEDVRFMSEVDESNPAEFFDGYQPRSTMESGNKSIEDLLTDVSNSVGRPSLRSSAVQSRKSTVNALTFDAMDDFMRTAASIEMQKSVAPALSEVNAFISAAKRSGNEDAVIFAETLRGVLDSYVKNTLARDYKQKGLYGNLWDSMGRKIKKNTLAGISKATVESLIQLGKVHIDEDANNAFYKNVSMKRNVSNQQILTALNSMNVARAGVLSSEMSRKRSFITDAVRRGDAGKAEELIYRASKTIPGRVVSGIDDFAGDFNTALIKFPDLVATVQVVIGGAAIRFKEITGEELDLDKVVNDPEYRAKYKEELDASIAYGDQLGTRMGGPGAMEQKSLQDIMGGDIRDLNRFVRSFSTNENEQILSALTTLGVPTSNVVMGKRERGAEFENKRKAARGLASSLFGLGGYTSLRMALGTLIMGLFGAMLNGDDWEEEFDYWDWDVFKARVLGDTIWTALFGKLGIVESLTMQTLIAFGIKQAYKASGEEEKGEKIADGMFYSTVDQNDKATKTFKMLGPEGKLTGSILETMYIASDAYEDQNFDLLSDPRFKNNLYTISKGALNLPAAQDVGVGVRKMWYGRDENRKVNESFGRSGDSRVIGNPQREVLRLYKETRDRFVLPSIIKDKPRKIRKKGVSFDVFISPFSVNDLQKLKGKFITRETNKLMTTREYINSSDSGKIELLKKIYKEWNNASSIKSISKGKYESIDDFYEKNAFTKPRPSK
jgi:hypothetical protein